MESHRERWEGGGGGVGRGRGEALSGGARDGRLLVGETNGQTEGVLGSGAWDGGLGVWRRGM